MAGSVNRRTFTKAVLAGLGAAAMPHVDAGAVPQTAATGQTATAKQLRIGCTSLVWSVFPRAPEPLEPALRDMSELGYKGWETFGQVLEDWDKKGTLDKLIAQYKIPLISAYAPLNVIDPSVRKNEIDMIVRWGKILRKHGGSFLVIEAGGAKRAGYDFAAHRANIVAALNDYGKAMADVGVGTGLHQHTGTAIETRDEVYAVMESVDTRVFKFAPDVGQLQKGGADAAKVVKDFAVHHRAHAPEGLRQRSAHGRLFPAGHRPGRSEVDPRDDGTGESEGQHHARARSIAEHALYRATDRGNQQVVSPEARVCASRADREVTAPIASRLAHIADGRATLE